MSTTVDGIGDMSPDEKRELLRELLAARSGADDRPDRGAELRREGAQPRDPPTLADSSSSEAGSSTGNPALASDGGPAPMTGPGRNGGTVGRADLPGAPLSYSQQRMWILHQLDPSSAAFNVEVVTPISGVFDPDAMSRALSDLVARHAVLRTSFVEVEGEPRQIAAPAQPLDVTLVDLSTMPASEAHARLQEFLQAEARRPFDLGSGPVIRASIVRIHHYEHILACYFHHIAVDGWSMGIFGRELTALYTEHVTGQPAVLPELQVQYADYARWQRSWLTGERLDAQVAFWTEQLRDLPTIEVPLDRPRPPVQRDDGATLDVSVPADLVPSLRRLCAEERTTPFIATLAAFATVLAKWSGERDLPIGTYVANRRRPELEQLMGFFLNTVVLRVGPDPSMTFRELLAQVRGTALAAYDHQDVPFELIVDTLQPVRDPSRSPLVQIVFQYNNAPTVEAPEGDAAFDAQRATSIYDLAMVLFDTAGGIGAQIEYRTSLFDADTVERLAHRFVHVLRVALANPDAEIGRMPLDPIDDVLGTWDEINATGVRHEWATGLVDMFEEQLERDHDAVALITETGTVSYGELASRAARIAHGLGELGLGRGDVVGVLLPRSADAVAAILGIVMSRAAWLPIDVEQPAPRVRTILDDGGAAAVVVSDEQARDPADLGTVTALDVASLGRDASPQLPTPRADPNDRAYVLFTSGSTGRPKGVAAPHGQIINRLHWMWREYPWRPGEVAVLTTSLGFVDSIWELFGSLLRGVPTVVIPQGAVADLDRLVERLHRHRVTRLWLVPSLLRALLDHVGDIGDRLPDLDMWVSSGETLPVELYERFRRALPGAALYNLYGTSEVWDATWCDPATVDLSSGRVPIGTPIDNVQTWIVDERDRPVPVGVPGELVVGGAGLTFGYLNGVDPDRFRALAIGTAGRSVPVFRTGDRAMLRPDGGIELMGRNDAQVKVRGVRVELDEIEAAVASHPHVGAAAVRHVTAGEPHLVAWFEALGLEVDPRTVRDHVASRLPAAMIPRRFIAVDALPRTSSGKIDRTGLVVDEPQRSISEPPVGEAEEALADVWREVLGVDEISRDDDFFADLGGHSLHATKVVSRARQAVGRDLPLAALFEHPTIREFAELLGDGGELGAAMPAASSGMIPRLDREAYRRQPTP